MTTEAQKANRTVHAEGPLQGGSPKVTHTACGEEIVGGDGSPGKTGTWLSDVAEDVSCESCKAA